MSMPMCKKTVDREFKSRSRDLARDSGLPQADNFCSESLRILACLSMRNNAPVEHCVAERISDGRLDSH